jgi:hypothetical protein
MRVIAFLTDGYGGREAPSTIAHAVDLLLNRTDFTTADTARIVIGPPLPASSPAWGFALEYDSAISNKTYSVVLQACAKVHVIRHGHSERESMAIGQLDGASVTADGGVVLVDGTRLRAVEAQHVRLPFELSPLDWRILRLVAEMIGIPPGDLPPKDPKAVPIDRCILRLVAEMLGAPPEDLPPKDPKAVPKWETLGFAALSKIFRHAELPALKEIRFRYRGQFAEKSSRAKISDTLRKVGFRA